MAKKNKKGIDSIKKIVEKIITTDYAKEMKQSFIDYAMSVNTDRAIADIRDGLKPVHRRILYSMYEQGFLPNKEYRKSATTVGNVLGKYHPHGDAAVYESMVRLTQNWLLINPLVDGHGNFGSLDGDPPAAMRYTEAKLSKIALKFLEDLDKNVVAFKPNFDEKEKEPTVLPAKFPNLLVNGSVGIGVAMATNIPTHNLREVVNGTIAYMRGEATTVEELMQYIKGPDFPTGGIITNKKDLLDIYKNGKGTLTIRSRIEREDAGRGKYNLVITEIPYTYAGRKQALIDRLISMINNKKLEDITSITDESNAEGVRIVIETKRNADLDKLENMLYKKTPVQDNMNVIFTALVDGEPITFDLLKYIEEFVKFQREIYTKKYEYLIDKLKAKQEIYEGLLIAYSNLDTIIECMRYGKSRNDMKKCLTSGDVSGIDFKTKKAREIAKSFSFSDMQAEVILETKLYKINMLEEDELKKELESVLKELNTYKKIISSRRELDKVIIKTLLDIVKEYGHDRKTEIVDRGIIEYKEEEIEEDVFVLIDGKNYIKTIDSVSLIKADQDYIDSFPYVLEGKSTERVNIFTKDGKLFSIKVSDIPRTKLRDKGIPVSNIVSVVEDDIIFANMSRASNKLLFITKNGFIKTVDNSEFETTRAEISSTKLNEDDELVCIRQVSEEDLNKDVVIITDKNNYLRFGMDEVPELKKNSVGVIAVKLADDDFVKTVLFVSPEAEEINFMDIALIAKKTKRNSKAKKIKK